MIPPKMIHCYHFIVLMDKWNLIIFMKFQKKNDVLSSHIYHVLTRQCDRMKIQKIQSSTILVVFYFQLYYFQMFFALIMFFEKVDTIEKCL